MNFNDELFKIFMDKHSLDGRLSEMSKLYETMKEIQEATENAEVQLHFNATEEVVLWLTLQEINEWFDFSTRKDV